MPKIKVNDIEMYYERHGQGEPLVLIAGFSADHTVWDAVIELLSKDYEVIVFDNRGAGQSDVPKGPYSIDQLADDVAALCKVLHIRQAHFIGNSMGGFIVQALSFNHPNLVKSAIISNSTFVMHTCFYYYAATQLDMIKANVPAAVLIKASCCWAFSFRFLSEPGVLDNLIQWRLDNPYPFTVTGYEAQYAAIETFDSREWVEKINVPTMVIGADQDLIFSEPSVKALANKIPQAEYYGFKDCGHVPQIEYPEEFVELATAYFKK